HLSERHFHRRSLRVLKPATAGIFVVILAIYPYVVIGQLPPYDEWLSRDQLLLPLGTALIVLALCRMVGNLLGSGAAHLAGMGVLLGSVIVSGSICASYFVDWQKQKTLIEVFRATSAMEDASTVI